MPMHSGMYTLCSLLNAKWNSDDTTTDFECSAKLLRCVKSAKYRYNQGCKMPINNNDALSNVSVLFNVRSAIDRDIYLFALFWVLCAVRSSRFFVCYFPLFRTLMSTLILWQNYMNGLLLSCCTRRNQYYCASKRSMKYTHEPFI